MQLQLLFAKEGQCKKEMHFSIVSPSADTNKQPGSGTLKRMDASGNMHVSHVSTP
jgi:hypothetical protein